MNNLITIKQVATLLGVTIKTVRRWENEGKIQAARTVGGHRRFDKDKLLKQIEKERLTVGYVRVSSKTPQKQLQQQLAILQAYRDHTDNNWEIIQDIGSSINYGNHGLLRLLHLLCHHRLQRLVILHRASLPRLGSELIFRLCEIFQVEIIVLNSLEATDNEVEWENDAEEIFGQLNAQLNAIHQQHDQELNQQLQAMICQSNTKKRVDREVVNPSVSGNALQILALKD